MVLIVAQESHLLLVLLLWRQLLLVLLVLLQEVADGFCVGQVDHVVFVASLVTRDLLVGSVAPVAIYSELVHAFLWVQELNKVVGGWRLIHSETLLSDAKGFQIVAWLDLLHALTLPIVEVAHYFNYLAAKRPLENVLYLGHEIGLNMLELKLGELLLLEEVGVLSLASQDAST